VLPLSEDILLGNESRGYCVAVCCVDCQEAGFFS